MAILRVAHLEVHAGTTQHQEDAGQAVAAAKLQDRRPTQGWTAAAKAGSNRGAVDLILLTQVIRQVNRALPQLEPA